MSKQHRILVVHKFEGERFAEGGLDIDVLPELIAYRNLLVETAKDLWRARHPTRERLPWHFEKSLSIKFFEIRSGSTVVPLERELSSDQPTLLFPRDELDDSVSLIAEAINNTREDLPLPMKLPKRCIALFEQYGSTLKENENFVLQIPAQDAQGVSATARYSLETRKKILSRIDGSYETQAEFVGEVRAADLDGQNFTIRLPDGKKVNGKFSREQETTITEALQEHGYSRLRIRGTGEFSSNGELRRIGSVADVAIETAAEPRRAVDRRPIWEIATKLATSVPAEEWAGVPRDLARNLHHYLYGHSKR